MREESEQGKRGERRKRRERGGNEEGVGEREEG